MMRIVATKGFDVPGRSKGSITRYHRGLTYNVDNELAEELIELGFAIREGDPWPQRLCDAKVREERLHSIREAFRQRDAGLAVDASLAKSKLRERKDHG